MQAFAIGYRFGEEDPGLGEGLAGRRRPELGRIREDPSQVLGLELAGSVGGDSSQVRGLLVTEGSSQVRGLELAGWGVIGRRVRCSLSRGIRPRYAGWSWAAAA